MVINTGTSVVPARTPPNPPTCDREARQEILDLLTGSVNLQESCKMGAMGTLGTGGVGLYLATQGAVLPAVGCLAVCGVFGYMTYTGWKQSGELIEQAVALNEQRGCYTPEQLEDIYRRIP